MRSSAGGEPGVPIPPRRIRRRVGPFENDPELFRKMGQDYLELMCGRQAIAPTDSVLDVGCGCGLMAFALTGYLTSGTYEGFDPDSRLIRWCRRNITPRFPVFSFRRVDVERYRDERARMRSSDVVFPYESATFDLVIVKSIFTHMFEAGIRRYMAEIHRVLKPGGQCVITWYVLDEESLALMHSGHSRWSFIHDRGNYRPLPKRILCGWLHTRRPGCASCSTTANSRSRERFTAAVGATTRLSRSDKT